MKLVDDAAPVSYPPEAILTTAQVADWLKVSEDAVDKMQLPRLGGFARLVRYSAGMVLAHREGNLDDYMGRWRKPHEQAA